MLLGRRPRLSPWRAERLEDLGVVRARPDRREGVQVVLRRPAGELRRVELARRAAGHDRDVRHVLDDVLLDDVEFGLRRRGVVGVDRRELLQRGVDLGVAVAGDVHRGRFADLRGVRGREVVVVEVVRVRRRALAERVDRELVGALRLLVGPLVPRRLLRLELDAGCLELLRHRVDRGDVVGPAGDDLDGQGQLLAVLRVDAVGTLLPPVALERRGRLGGVGPGWHDGRRDVLRDHVLLRGRQGEGRRDLAGGVRERQGSSAACG